MRYFILVSYIFVLLPVFAQNTDNILDEASAILGTEDVYLKSLTPYCSVAIARNTGCYVIFGHNGTNARVIGFSKSSQWKDSDMPEALMKWLMNYVPRFNTDIPISEALHTTSREQTRTDIAPLLSTHWHQQSPYNDLAPVIADGNIKTVAGCVAIAAAQIAYYWWRDNPEYTLKDTPTYPYSKAPVTYSIPSGTPNNWQLIKNEYHEGDSEESRAAVAQLCYVVGTTSYLNYGSSTGGSTREASKAIRSQYELTSSYLNKRLCNQERWDSLIYDNLSKSMPILCSGTGGEGHAFVMDGYDAKTGLYHFNFGWGGSGDGYYTIDDTEEAMGGYYLDQAIVYDIRPLNRNISAVLTHTNTTNADITLLLCIRNSSTLPCFVSLFEVQDNDDINETLIWEGSQIDNDDTEQTLYIKVDCERQNAHYVLKDEYGKSLAEIFVDKSDTGIVYKSVENHTGSPYYDIRGISTNGKQPHGIILRMVGERYQKFIGKQ